MLTILVAAGDGIGPEVVEAALHVMDGLGLEMELVIEPVGMAGVEERGHAIADATVELAREADAILLGAAQTPPPGAPYRSPLLTLRREMGLFANVRPARPLLPWLSRICPQPGGTGPVPLDVIVVRELTEGLYAGRERETPEGAVAEKVVSRMASHRISRFAFELARARGRRLVTCVHKANVLRLSDRVFVDEFHRAASEVGEGLGSAEIHVDAAAAAMVADPASLDVLVAPNLYGDILSDLAAALCGGLGMAPSASLGTGTPLFEPIHGAAPDIAGEGIANPVGCILSAAMMLEHLGHERDAARIEAAVVSTLGDGVRTPDLGGRHTTLGFAMEARERLEASM